MEKQYKLTKEERETIISDTEADKEVNYYTCSPKQMRLMDSRTEEFPEIFKKIREDPPYSKTYTFPKKYVYIRKPRILTEEQKRQRVERLNRRNKK